jgi:uncharacterized protein
MTTLIEPDIQDIAQIDQINQMPQLLSIAVELGGQLVNLRQIGRQMGLNSRTVGKYLGILGEVVFGAPLARLEAQ